MARKCRMGFWVYILASGPGGTLYVGIANYLVRRVLEDTSDLSSARLGHRMHRRTARNVIRTGLRAGTLISCALLICISSSSAAQDVVADFYRGKQVTIMVGFTAGGSSSLYAQALA